MLSNIMLAWTLTVTPTHNAQSQEMHFMGQAPSDVLWVPTQIIVSESSKDLASHCQFMYSLQDSESNILANQNIVGFNGPKGNGPSTSRGLESLTNYIPSYSVNSNLTMKYYGNDCENNEIRVDVLAYPVYQNKN